MHPFSHKPTNSLPILSLFLTGKLQKRFKFIFFLSCWDEEKLPKKELAV